MSDRTYSEKEVAALLERATEMQIEASRRTETRPGLTLAELEDIATEAGLDPTLLRRAAQEMETSDGTLITKNTSTSATHIYVERRIRGPLTPEAVEEVVAELRHRFDSDMMSSMMGSGMGGSYGRGTVEQVGRTVEWRHTSMSGIETHMQIRPRGEDLHLKLSQRVGLASPAAESVFYGMMLSGLVTFISGVASGSWWMVAAVLLATLATSIPLILFADRRWRARKHQELEALSDRLTGLIRAASPLPEPTAGPATQTSAAKATPQPAPRIDPTLLHPSTPTEAHRILERDPTRDH